MSDTQPTYRFRWTNIDLHDFVKQRREAADILRQDATILMRRAEQIEAEMRVWENALEVADGA